MARKVKGKDRDVMQEITDKVIAAIEQGIAKPDGWVMPWRKLGTMAARNVVTGKRYRGINSLILGMVAEDAGALPLWAGSSQWRNLGFEIPGGQRATWGAYWKVIPLRDKDGNPQLDEDGEPGMIFRPMPFAVWHIGQVRERTVRYSGRIRKVQHEGPKTAALKAQFAPKFAPTAIERHEHAEKVLTAVGATTLWGGDRAFYRTSDDTIRLPQPEQFDSGEALVSVWAHELGHWTGHKGRLARTYGKRFGDPAYAAEELVAELTSTVTCQHLGIEQTIREDHLHYLANWLKALKNDKGFLYTAAKHAEAAFVYLMEAAGEDMGEDETEAPTETAA